MTDDPVSIVAQKGRETYLAIRELRKTLPQYTRGQKDELTRREKELQDKWWEEVKPYMRSEGNPI